MSADRAVSPLGRFSRARVSCALYSAYRAVVNRDKLASISYTSVTSRTRFKCGLDHRRLETTTTISRRKTSPVSSWRQSLLATHTDPPASSLFRAATRRNYFIRRNLIDDIKTVRPSDYDHCAWAGQALFPLLFSIGSFSLCNTHGVRSAISTHPHVRARITLQ